MAKELKILDVKKETGDSCSITFEVPQNLKNEFKYTPGQYLTLVLRVDGNKYKRSYSLSSSPFINEHPTIAVKRVKDGVISNYINDSLKKGDIIEVEKPNGNFKLETGFFKFKKYVFFAGGSGITPIISMITSVLAKEPFSNVTLFFGNRSEKDIIYKDRLDQLQLKYAGKFELIYVLENPSTGWKGYSGILDQDQVNKLIDAILPKPQKCEYFICGPQPMMEAVSNALGKAGVNKGKIHLEYFSAPVSSEKSKTTKASAGTTKNVVVVFDGKEHEFPVLANQNILDAGLNANIDLSFSCRAGVCCSCKAKLVSGEVSMEEVQGLSACELKAGYILTCQAIALTDEVRIEF